MGLPVVWANYISIALFRAWCGVWSIPKSAVVPAEFESQSWRDLRLWATGLILFQIALRLLQLMRDESAYNVVLIGMPGVAKAPLGCCWLRPLVTTSSTA